MLGIKRFVQESVQSLPPSQLRLLAETLRVDLRGCEDRGDIERVLTGLVCLDQDTSLGVFLAWLRSSDLHQNQHGILASKKAKFNSTFLPAIASPPEVRRDSNNQQSRNDSDDRVKDHHLNDEIKQQLAELDVLEASFKKAERLVHTGSPSFEKLKQFLVELTILRAKEQKARAFLVRQVNVLREQHDEMRAEMLHSRAQLDFFVEGFTNLRKRHDALLADATRIKAESESTQDIFVAMSAHDCHFEQLMRNTLWKQMRDNDEMQRRLKQAYNDLDAAAQKRKELEAHISQLKQERGDARKDAYCYKHQLRVCKARMRRLQQAGGGANGSFFREQAIALRQTVATLIGLLRDAVVRDTKSPKQTLSKEALRVLQQVISPNVGALEPDSNPVRLLRATNNKKDDAEAESKEIDPSQPRIVERRDASSDLDEVIRGVLLVEDANASDAAECAHIMSEKVRYFPVNVKQTLLLLQQDEERQAQATREEEQNKLQQLLQQQQAGGQGTDGAGDSAAGIPALSTKAASQTPAQSSTTSAPVEPRPPPTLEAYAAALKKHIDVLMAAQGKCGFVMFNWPFSRRDVTLLTSVGFSVDSVLNLEIVGAAQPSPVPSISTPPTPATAAARGATPANTTPSTPAQAKTSATAKTPASKGTTRSKAAPSAPPARGKISPSKTATTAASKSPAKPVARPTAPSGAKARAASPTRTPASPKKPATVASTSKPKTPVASSKPGTSSSQKAPTTAAAKVVKKVPTMASALQGLGGILQPIGPATFPAERVNIILQVLEQQRRKKVAPTVQWDENTRRTNEMLAMWAEEVHMLVHMEQEARKPQKAPTPSATPSSPTKSTTTSPRRTASPSKTSASKPATKSKPASPTRSSSPAKATATKVRPPKK